jgi:hypothetical protein
MYLHHPTRAGSGFEITGGDDDLLAAEILDDALFGLPILAYALDEIQVGVAVDVLLADEHVKFAAHGGWIRQSKIGKVTQFFSITRSGAPLPLQADQ